MNISRNLLGIKMRIKALKFSLFYAAFPLIYAASSFLSTPAISKEAIKLKLNLSGSSTIAPLANELSKAFETKYPIYRLDVQSGGSSKGLADARSGLSDLGMISRDLTEKESDLQGTPIAYDGIAIIVNKENPLKDLKSEQVISIYTGKYTNWKELGGVDQPITVVNKAEGRSTLELFLQFFSLKNSDVKAKMIVGENEQAIKFIGSNQWSIGYVSIGSAEYASTVSKTIRTVRLNGIDATLSNVRNKTYPLRRTLNFVHNKSKSEKVQKFLSFLKEPAAIKIIEEQFFVPF
jgi:phosphate transport system substrate-binding protein